MSRIIRAVNAMVSHPERIVDVLAGVNGRELFFVYLGHKWSVVEAKPDEYVLHFYPEDDISIAQLAAKEGEDWEYVSMVTYLSKQLGGREALESMQELHTLVTEKVHGIDAVLDEIIASDAPPF